MNIPIDTPVNSIADQFGFYFKPSFLREICFIH